MAAHRARVLHRHLLGFSISRSAGSQRRSAFCNGPSDRGRPLSRSSFKYFLPIQTRWMDNDMYGHANNAHYYSWFDTVVNEHLIVECGVDVKTAPAIALVVHSECDYFQPVSFPALVDAGLRVARLGTSSVTYEIGIFASDRTADGAGASARASTSGGGAEQASALGQFVHVFVSRDERRPVPIPPRVKEQLERLKVSE